MLGYKAANNGSTRVLITLEIPKDARTTLNRASIAVWETATYRANKVKVLKIEDENGTTYPNAVSGFFSKKLEYRVGEILEDASYDTNVENVYSSGIHFFLTRQLAEQYGIRPSNGIVQTWHENGKKCAEGMYENGYKHGVWTFWFNTGQKCSEGMYKNGNGVGGWNTWVYDERRYDDSGNVVV